MMRAAAWAAGLLGMGVLVSCGDAGDPVTVVAGTETELVAGDATLSFEQFSLTTDTELVFRELDVGRLGRDGRDHTPIGTVVEILPHDLVFPRPVVLHLALSGADADGMWEGDGLTAADGWRARKGEDLVRPPRTEVNANVDTGEVFVDVVVEGGGVFWVSQDFAARPVLQADVGPGGRVIVSEGFDGAYSFTNTHDAEIYGASVSAGDRPLVAIPGTRALASLSVGDQIATGLAFTCENDGIADAAIAADFGWEPDASYAVAARLFRRVECYRDTIPVDPTDPADQCPEPPTGLVLASELPSLPETEDLTPSDEGACHTIAVEQIAGISQVWLHARPPPAPGARSRGDYVLVSANPDGVAGSGSSWDAHVSDFADRVIFTTQAQDLIGAVDDAEVALADLDPVTLLPVRITRFDNGPSRTDQPDLSGNGLWAAAVSGTEIRLMNLRPPIPASVSFQADAWSPALDETGRHVAFVTAAALVPEDTDGVASVYVADRDPDGDETFGDPAFTLVSSVAGGPLADPTVVGLSSSGDEVLWIGGGDVFATPIADTGAVRRVSEDTFGTPAGDVVEADLSRDGKFAVFATHAWVTLSISVSEVWVADLVTGELALVSRDASGAAAALDSTSPRISPDGETIAFASDALLTVDDEDGGTTLYRAPNPLFGR